MREFLKQNWLLILSLIYLLSPIDLIPEGLVGPLGLVDDFGLLLLLLLRASYYHLRKSHNPSREVDPR